MTKGPLPAPTPEQVAAAVVAAKPNWWGNAACLGSSVTGFDADGDPGPEARAVCASCQVRVECIADEVIFPAEWVLGFRGGLTAPERRQLVAEVASIVNGRFDRAARVRCLRSQGLTVHAIAHAEGTSVRTIYRLLAEIAFAEVDNDFVADAG